MRAWFNDIDPVSCAVLRGAQSAGIIAPGIVDERSIKEIMPHDIHGYRQAHFFAGAGLWSIAARLAGWSDNRPLWSASCPCQPFSAAGKGLGTDDPRHLWPDLFRLVDACRPACIVGEQVAGKSGDAWLDGVCVDLESIGYSVRAVEVPASAVDSPQKRSRNWWVAMAGADGGDACAERLQRGGKQRLVPEAGSHPGASRDCQRAESSMASADSGRRDGWTKDAIGRALGRDVAEWVDGAVEHPASDGWREGRPEHELRSGRDAAASADLSSFWSDHEWLQCADGKARRTKPGLRLLVDGMAGRTDLWRLAGNSIVPLVAAQVLASLADEIADQWLEQRDDERLAA